MHHSNIMHGLDALADTLEDFLDLLPFQRRGPYLIVESSALCVLENQISSLLCLVKSVVNESYDVGMDQPLVQSYLLVGILPVNLSNGRATSLIATVSCVVVLRASLTSPKDPKPMER